ncbi:hypothetical protein AB0J72_54075 [Dactylosporangium sp. NPDC049742]|uniref:hypothetical protein n=1 Tax=Dactylosporangium sp. NPDC049742 TaxID=3154737 RepID=UPI0034202E6A
MVTWWCRPRTGVQVGDHNTQVNHHVVPRQPLTRAHLTDLDPVAAARRLLREDVDEAAVLLVGIAPDEAVPLLQRLLAADEARTVAVLCSMHRGKAAALIRRLRADTEWIGDLPDAVTEIRAAHATARALLGDESGPVEPHPAPPPLRAFRLPCARGAVYWHRSARPVAVPEPTDGYYLAAGGPGGRLGLPVGAAADGSLVTFDGLEVEGDDWVVVESRAGVFTTTVSRLEVPGMSGAPVAEIVARGDGTLQRFEYADIHSDGAGGHIVVDEAVRAFLGHSEAHRRPVGPAAPPVRSAYGRRGFWQDFGPPDDPVTVYVADGWRPIELGQPMQEAYLRAGGPEGWLGFPRGRSYTRWVIDKRHDPFQFEGGVIVAGADGGPTAVPMDLYRAAVSADLGPPVGEVQRLGAADDLAQFFAGGAVTVRGGRTQIWVERGSPA